MIEPTVLAYGVQTWFSASAYNRNSHYFLERKTFAAIAA